MRVTAAAAAVGLQIGKPARAAAPAERLKIGLASYSLRKLPLDRVIEACREMDVHYISIKDVHLPRTDPPEKLKADCARIRAAGMTIMGGGVIGMKKDAAQIRKDFEYARICGFPLIVIAPEYDALDIVESMVKEFGIKAAIHNHGPKDKFPTPKEAIARIKNRDGRLGVCLDIGHAAEAGADPVMLARECGARLFDVHVKDQRVPTDMSTQVEVGKGSVDVAGVLKVLYQTRYQGHIALEYELHPEDPVAGVRESLAYLRGVAAGLSA